MEWQVPVWIYLVWGIVFLATLGALFNQPDARVRYLFSFSLLILTFGLILGCLRKPKYGNQLASIMGGVVSLTMLALSQLGPERIQDQPLTAVESH